MQVPRVFSVLWLSVVLAIPPKRETITHCSGDHECKHDECCALSFGIRLCKDCPSVGEQCNPGDPLDGGFFSECHCEHGLSCVPYSTYHMCVKTTGHGNNKGPKPDGWKGKPPHWASSYQKHGLLKNEHNGEAPEA